MGYLKSYQEVFHGCKQSADFFISQVKTEAKKHHIYVALEQVSYLDGIILNYLIKNNKLHSNFRKDLVTKFGMMIGYIIPQIKNISNITIIGIEVDYNFDDEYIKLTKKQEQIILTELSKNKLDKYIGKNMKQMREGLNRYRFMKRELHKRLQKGQHILYYGYHVDYGKLKDGHILNGFKEKYGTRKIQLFIMCSPKIKTTFLFVKNKKFPKDNVIKQFQIENDTFNKAVNQYKNRLRGEKSLIKYIEDFIPPTNFELKLQKKYGNKITIINKSHIPKNSYSRKYGIWAAYWEKTNYTIYDKKLGYTKVSNTKPDKIVYIPDAILL